MTAREQIERILHKYRDRTYAVMADQILALIEKDYVAKEKVSEETKKLTRSVMSKGFSKETVSAYECGFIDLSRALLEDHNKN